MIAKWIVVALMVLSILLTILSIGRPRKPITPGDATFMVTFQAVLIVTVLVWWQ